MLFDPIDEEEVHTFKGVLKRIRFTSENGEFSISELEIPDRPRALVVVGNLLSAKVGETVEVRGRYKNDLRYGLQFRYDHIRTVPPSTKEGIERYLAGGFIDGIGPVLAKRIVETFGHETLEVLDADPTRLEEVEGIGPKRSERLAEAWLNQRALRDVIVFLQSHGISPTFAVKILDLYGASAIQVVQENPYKLAEDVFGIGFKRADDIAQASGMDPEAMPRLKAAILYVLTRAHSEGHVFLPMELLKERTGELLGLEPQLLGGALEHLRQEQHVTLEPTPMGGVAVYRARAWRSEVDAARHIHRLTRGQLMLQMADVDEVIAEVEQELTVELARAQRRAIRAAWEHKVVVITGGPGTGKTTIIRAVTHLGARIGLKLSLAAPTGRAAKRLGEATGQPSSTLHRLLEYSFHQGGFQFGDERQLDTDWLVVDEASMIDTYLMSAIARALPDHARLLLVGDVDQLPSVGPGNVLSDVMQSGCVEVVRLTEIFRQAQQSNIVLNAHRINRGELPEAPGRSGKELVDFYAIEVQEPVDTRERILHMVCERIPNAFGYDAIDDVQILSPMHKGEVGCKVLNEVLQERFNPGADELVRGHRRFKVGDKVMQQRNNYDLDVFNGDTGRIARIDEAAKVVTVTYEGRLVGYEFTQLDELELAYAITVHKSQGSEYPCVVLPVVTQHFIMLQRNLLYTAITRARELVILVGTQRAVGIAVRNTDARHRYTRLVARLQEAAKTASA